MKLEPIIISLLDTDLYKFNMDQVIFHKHTDLCGQYFFKCRNKDVVFTPEMVQEINDQIDHLCSLTFKKEELDYLRSIRFIKNDGDKKNVEDVQRFQRGQDVSELSRQRQRRQGKIFHIQPQAPLSFQLLF